MELYADIIIDISHSNLDKTFQYRIPKNQEEQISIGMLVKIPFGKGNRITRGYVVEITSQPKYDINLLKEIVGIELEAIAIESQLIKLAWWIKENYGSNMISALKTVIPIKQKVKLKQKRLIQLEIDEAEATLQLNEAIKKNHTAKARLLEELINNNKMDYDIIVDKLHISTTTINNMEKKGIIKIDSKESYRNPIKNTSKEEYTITLTKEQQEIVSHQMNEYNQGIRKTYLIHGITGSGKTEVYMAMIDNVIKNGKQVILLIPEIALTYQTVMRFYQKFKERISIINSKLSKGERFDQYLRAKRGEIDIMIGPRSALFTPFLNLGLIVIDEEHEGTYKSETAPKYHARETAIYRARITNSSVILGSATPSLEAYTKSLKGEYHLYKLYSRAKKSELPMIHTVDLREELKEGNKSIISVKLRESIKDRLKKREQIMIFINKRGYAGFVSCRSCGLVLKCPHCDISLTAHQTYGDNIGDKNKKLICHYCGYETKLPANCPSCNSVYIAAFGTGTQKVEELLKNEFPQAGILRMDMDTTGKKDSHERILASFSNHEADILVGTQMIVKGHDFPNVTLVGILAADLSLFTNDYRAGERTFQLLTQAAGRAGRGKKKGEVIIQTYNPKHYSVVTAGEQDYTSFYNQEMQFRRLMKYPPVAHILVLLIQSRVDEIAKEAANILNQIASRYLTENNVEIIGPAPATLTKINDIYRRVLYIKHTDYNTLRQIKNHMEEYIEVSQHFNKCMVQFDFNPMSTY